MRGLTSNRLILNFVALLLAYAIIFIALTSIWISISPPLRFDNRHFVGNNLQREQISGREAPVNYFNSWSKATGADEAKKSWMKQHNEQRNEGISSRKLIKNSLKSPSKNGKAQKSSKNGLHLHFCLSLLYKWPCQFSEK